jgi:Uma2 family endonuclease
MVLSRSPDLVNQPDIPLLPPTDLESVEPQLETDRHVRQLLLLLACLEYFWADRQDFFAGGNLTIYFSDRQLKSQDFRGPDFFVVLNTERRERKSWVVWAEDGKYPNVIFEVLSDSTANSDRTTKKQIYQDIFRTPEYFWFHPYTFEFQGFRLTSLKYEPIQPNESGWLWSEELQLFIGIFEQQMRFFTPAGELVLLPAEIADRAQQQIETERQRAETERQRAETERQRAEQAEAQLEAERQKAAQLQQRLRELGIDVEDL